MANGHATLGATISIGVAALLGATCLAGAALYNSSAGSAAVQEQLSQTCASDAALTLPLSLRGGQGEVLERASVDPFGSAVAHLQPALLTSTVAVTLRDDQGLTSALRLLYRDGVNQQVEPPLQRLGPNEIALSRSNLALRGFRIGDRLVAEGTGGDVELVIAQTFDDLPFLPERDYWCGDRALLRPTPMGDPPPVWALASADAVGRFGRVESFLEFRPVSKPLTTHEASAMNRGAIAALTAFREQFDVTPRVAPPSQLDALISRARALATAVKKSVAAAELAGAVAAALILAASGVMLARERRRDLHLLAIRGESPWRAITMLGRSVIAPIAVGMIGGFWLAFAAVRSLGPAPQIERAAVQQAVFAVAGAFVAAVGIVATAAAIVGDRFVDSTHRRRRRLWVPIELAVVALAVVSFRRLDRGGGLRSFGVESRGGELLAQAFPLFALAAVVAVAARPLRALITMMRRTGGRWPRAIRLGWRRVVMDAGLTVTLVAAVSLACGCFMLSATLSASAEQQLDDKASTYAGADLTMNVFDDVVVPADLADRATVVLRLLGRLDGQSFDVLGVDHASFAHVVRLRDDASAQSIDTLMAAIAPVSGQPTPALLVRTPDPGDAFTVETANKGQGIELRAVASAAFFPGLHNGASYAVVDRRALAEAVTSYRRAVWIRDPPADAVERIRATGVRIGAVTRADEVFDTSSYSAQRWSYIPLAALGILFAAVAITMQLLVIEARRTSRQLSHAIMRRTRFGTRAVWTAASIEISIPLVIGALVGVGGGLLGAALSIQRLDPLPGLQPAAELVVPIAPLGVLGGLLATAVLVLAGLTVRSTVRVDTMEVIRGTA